ncbi:MAG: segregation/condensation protein A [Thermoflexus sp.]|jgi:segregation and condensation protein A|nr:segregation/condensation protein A [Thermoflexus sp.]
MRLPFRPTLPPVRLPVFEGPLDLLLYLIERNDLDITQVSLAQIAEQYLEYVAILQALTLDQLAEYLVIAAKLLYIKSSLLLPRPPEPDAVEEDAGEALVEQLKAYRLFRELARRLQAREGFTTYGRTAPPPRLEPAGTGLEGIILEDLLRLARRALRSAVEGAPVGAFLPAYRLTIEEAMEQILEAVRKGERVAFTRLLRTAGNHSDGIAFFLGLLELLKRRRVMAYQNHLFDEIYIEPFPERL